MSATQIHCSVFIPLHYFKKTVQTRDNPSARTLLIPSLMRTIQALTWNDNTGVAFLGVTNMTTNLRILCSVTPYEGDNFDEADYYPDYVLTQLTDRYPGADITVIVGSHTRVRVEGPISSELHGLARDIDDLLKVGLWDDFCAHGYKAYLKVSAESAE